jgi:NAD(P)-dependent dehydrogenase (short-subunit alcohol dehydrogenase family)
MEKVCVITGGGSGIGLATAKILGRENYIILAGRTLKKLKAAVSELESLGIKAETFVCDTSDLASVQKLAAHARAIGKVSCVLQSAGLSPHMADARTILRVNALGTVNVNDAFFEVVEEGSCIIDVSSFAAYFMPAETALTALFELARTDKELFIDLAMEQVATAPEELRSSMAYSISKSFTIWCARTDAGRFGEKGARVLSVSPGLFETPMGEAEKITGLGLTEVGAIKRMGHVDEIAYLLSYLMDEKLGYLTGTDIVCDGGVLASGAAEKRQKA